MYSRFIICARALVILFACIGIVTTTIFLAMQFGWLNVRGGIAARNAFFENARASSTLERKQPAATSPWYDTDEWHTVAAGLEKDKSVILHVAEETGVSARLIAAVAVPEQLRFFTANREVFKRYFEPFKLLGTLSQFSLGVTGIKPETAERIESYANDPESEFYPGEKIAALMPPSDDEARFLRLTDEDDHYYQYLYTALFIAEIQAQWKKAGHADVLTPGVITTLFNIGFDRSNPNAKPEVGGAPIELGGATYTYGELGASFYESTELPVFH
ncbi:hypothetical protein A3C89_03955 [Candidatus Kaiserbacteria bacterium RIFCSPHIGHO2_02_FULL_50_50]|uniref:Uncharacterized protein n=1 Tax=Candidatus Kaiserbacteria bacterium RIFCSPHIGHO2_02_FULL_50_50 TaxID=1798492 RepID=A0A1F6DFD1_9BACT|nr:MAG: hypothetical protein A3C89_03955 [Candidatus Kaiserbacteria bacterium RIFCSPHIGHO2_02_FULL_50_50]OGG88465.1 MAG: hypothetical protein A3G62_01920 [Candidatus Kaiserbacteria bacterium RIFCSPLOWO2_12_FULL_50_10]